MAGEQSDLNRSQELRSTKVRSRGVEILAPPTQLRRRHPIEHLRESRAAIGVESRLLEERKHERAKIESSPPDDDGSASRFESLGSPSRRILRP